MSALSDPRNADFTRDLAREGDVRDEEWWQQRTGHQLPPPAAPGPATADPAGDAARQKLRRLERGVRRWKLVAKTALTEQARQQAQARVRQLQQQVREHVAATGVTRQRYREQLFLDNQPPLA